MSVGGGWKWRCLPQTTPFYSKVAVSTAGFDKNSRKKMPVEINIAFA